MDTTSKKIRKIGGFEHSEFEESVAQALSDLENTNQDLKSDLKDLYINDAFKIGLPENRKAVVIYYPFRFRYRFRKIQPKLVRELEKNYFSGNEDVFLIPSRRRKGGSRFFDATMRDVVRPAEIVGRCILNKKDGHDLVKCYLDSNTRNETEKKLEAFVAVSKKIFPETNFKFEYPITEEA